MRDKRNIIIAILVLVIIVGVGYVAYGYTVQKSYLAGYQTAQIDMLNGIVQQLDQQGYVTITFPYQNQTVTVHLAPVQQEGEQR